MRLKLLGYIFWNQVNTGQLLILYQYLYSFYADYLIHLWLYEMNHKIFKLLCRRLKFYVWIPWGENKKAKNYRMKKWNGILTLLLISVFTFSQTSVTQLLCNNLKNPVGIGVSRQLFIGLPMVCMVKTTFTCSIKNTTECK